MDEEVKIEGKIDINQALKDFEAKSKVEEAQKIPEVSKNSDVPKMVELVMKWSGGAIKEQKTAEYVLFGFVVLMFAVSFYLFFGGSAVKVKSPALDIINRPQPAEGFIPR